MGIEAVRTTETQHTNIGMGTTAITQAEAMVNGIDYQIESFNRRPFLLVSIRMFKDQLLLEEGISYLNIITSDYATDQPDLLRLKALDHFAAAALHLSAATGQWKILNTQTGSDTARWTRFNCTVNSWHLLAKPTNTFNCCILRVH